jgi:hypothetical protein
MASLNDPHVSKGILTETQWDGGTEVLCYRLNGSNGSSLAVQELKLALCHWQPDWLSLQYVAFGYQKKGLPIGLARALMSLAPTGQWQIMIHEIWVGAFVGAPIKLRILGKIQQIILRHLLRVLRPAVICTQTVTHQRFLAKWGHSVKLLPLFGNIPVLTSEKVEVSSCSLLAPRLLQGAMPVSKSEAPMVAVLFGVIHPEWSPEPFISRWIEALEGSRRRPVLLLIGSCGQSDAQLRKLFSRYRERLTIKLYGKLSEQQVSQVLETAHFGLATTPWHLIGKSGSAAAMRDHGLTVVVCRDDWRPRGLVPEVGHQGFGDWVGPLPRLADSLTKDEIRGLVRQRSADSLAEAASRFLTDLEPSFGGACQMRHVPSRFAI